MLELEGGRDKIGVMTLFSNSFEFDLSKLFIIED